MGGSGTNLSLYCQLFLVLGCGKLNLYPVLVLGHNLLLSITVTQVGKIYACEIIPTRHRAKVCAIEQLVNWMVNFAVILTAPLFLHSSPSGPYFLYGTATLCAMGMCLFIPETKGRSLEEIEELFKKD